MEPFDQEYYRECDYCKKMYPEDEGYSSIVNLKAECCSNECAERYDEENDNDE